MKKGQHKSLLAIVSALAVLITLCAAVSINGCGSVDSYPDGQAAVVPSTDPLQIAAAGNATSVKKNETLQLTATEYLADGTTVDRTSEVTWTSSDQAIATVSAKGGLVTGVGSGKFTITATLGTLVATFSLRVPATALY